MMDLLHLPVVVLENIISYLSYDEIAKNRIVSKGFNELCSKMLNRGFLLIERRHGLALKNVKAQLPRRESERRYHHLSRHCDILTSIETRISMLNMTYSKYVESGLCCFIPGKVLDEIKRVLAVVETATSPPRAHEVLQELRDISSMAIEHFDEKVSPTFRKALHEGVGSPTPLSSHCGSLAPMTVNQELYHMRRRTMLTSKLSLYLASNFKIFHKKMREYRKIAYKQRRMVKMLNKKLKEQDSALADLKKRIEECDIKYSELTHTNQAAGAKAISGGGSEVSPPASQSLRHFSSQIKLDLSVLPIGTSKKNHNKLMPNMKPRKPLIKLPSLSEDEIQLSPKPSDPVVIPKVEDIVQPVIETKGKRDVSTNTSPRFPAPLPNFKGMTTDILTIANMSKKLEGRLKRSLQLTSDLSEEEIKKQKLG